MLHFYDNLDIQISLSLNQPNCVYRYFCTFFLKNLIDNLALPYDGLISLIDYRSFIFIEQCHWDDENIYSWEGTMTESEQRILITHLLVKAW